ncbi:hypothetical protein FDN13_09685 [Caloramator sp. E03]|uniref:glycerol dehydratase reactivase beta/small subunit family protein n=1 Tax=Caloramator sp. E03 TaxID=2576307 RepID=UPI001110E1CC|nr:glycerol dehydratase reactivase beta/small subunit family protein [Caloramator sp. E03]QCX33952.1 hypothetical protein FDN13_09685 [Caloramator sp. E03]
MDIIKPSIVIFKWKQSLNSYSEIALGIEEEGALYTIYESDENAYEMAYKAALKSKLGIGIGIDDKVACIVLRNMKKGQALFVDNIEDRIKMRILGYNAARYVKGEPFIIKD